MDRLKIKIKLLTMYSSYTHQRQIPKYVFCWPLWRVVICLSSLLHSYVTSRFSEQKGAAK